jgi:hypothetical protein
MNNNKVAEVEERYCTTCDIVTVQEYAAEEHTWFCRWCGNMQPIDKPIKKRDFRSSKNHTHVARKDR